MTNERHMTRDRTGRYRSIGVLLCSGIIAISAWAPIAGAEALEGVYVNLMTAVDSMDTPEVKKANEILAKYYPKTKPGYYPYLGMAGGIIIVEAIKRAGNDLT